jgi:trans-aconitate 2-methyltransferase
MKRVTNWDPALYEARHSFVWQFGQDLLELLGPKPGERVLDVGCGPGNLTEKISQRGARVVGIDSSPEMIGQARQNYPSLNFVLADAAQMQFQEEFDAVFSNAALHWMLDADGVARGIARALKKGGRLVAELGGKGNIQIIERAIEHVLATYLPNGLPSKRTFFPSVGEYASTLERNGLEIRAANLFDRPTKLEGSNGMEDWLRQFASYYFETIPATQREGALRAVVSELRPALLGGEGWLADYRRLRIQAVKV